MSEEPNNTHGAGTSSTGTHPLDTRQAYAILDRIVTYGYDYLGISLRGHNYVLKTLTTEEEDAIRSRTFGAPNRAFSIAWMMAYCTLYLDGIDMAAIRDEDTLHMLYGHYCLVPASTVAELYGVAVKLTHRADLATTLYQGYLFSGVSRMKWITFKDSGGNWGVGKSHSVVGSPTMREVWSRGNHMLDVEETDSREWDRTTFMASAFNPKGVKDTITKMKSQRKMVADDREELIQYGSFGNRDVILGLLEEDEERWTAPLRTQQDIIEELERQMTGVKDRHDLFVEKYDREMAELAAARKAEEMARIMAVRRKRQEEQYMQFEGQREATDEELSRLGLLPNTSPRMANPVRKVIRAR